MIYLDNNSTTQPSRMAVEAMLPYLTDRYFNASASTAAFTGADKPEREAANALAKLLKAEEPVCFAFTSGATESNNWVFTAAARAHRFGRVIISAIEHVSVSEPAAELKRQGFDVIEVPVDRQGVIQIDVLARSLSEDTILVSVIAANNETGVLEPIAEIGRLVRQHCPNALFHTDATQAVGKIPIDLMDQWQELDFLSFSAHKFHGPKGVGGLYIRPGIKVAPMLRGGGQERGLRSGTVNTPGLAGTAAAARAIDMEMMARVQSLRDELESSLVASSKITIHSTGAPRLPNTSCFSVCGFSGNDIAHSLAAEGIVVGTGSACSAGAISPPKTVLALGVDYATARGTLRVSLSSLTTPSDIQALIDALEKMRIL